MCEPAESVEVVNWASSTPPTTESDTGVCAWPSIVNVTVPVGVPGYDGAVTTAVNVTGWPTVAGFSDDETVVVEAGRDASPTAASRTPRCPRRGRSPWPCSKASRLGHRESPMPEPSILTVTAWTNVSPCSCPGAGFVGLEKISTTYDVFGDPVNVPESVPEPPVPGVKVRSGALDTVVGLCHVQRDAPLRIGEDRVPGKLLGSRRRLR